MLNDITNKNDENTNPETENRSTWQKRSL